MQDMPICWRSRREIRWTMVALVLNERKNKSTNVSCVTINRYVPFQTRWKHTAGSCQSSGLWSLHSCWTTSITALLKSIIIIMCHLSTASNDTLVV